MERIERTLIWCKKLPNKAAGSKRQVFDLPQPKLEVTEHQIGEIECCGCAQQGEYPPEIRAGMQYRAGVRALVTKLSVEHKMPLEQICCLFADLYGYLDC